MIILGNDTWEKTMQNDYVGVLSKTNKKKTVSDFLLELFLLMHVSFRFLRNNLAWVGLGNKDS